ncbi:hypothetical protein BKK56_03640 [Rodentibacter genomosp. 2]|uniref:hypothetical protein n=1 Tax=Rodentibacter genomosp. 2 TaxID=1908266 RepID=UPI000986C9AA|nr:hypothetical protein BKK56_03640 [Rodentibacter genomosp. 2]
MSNKVKQSLKTIATLGMLALVSANTYAAGLGDIGANIDFSDGKAAVIAVTTAVAGFLVIGLAARTVLGFFKRI